MKKPSILLGIGLSFALASCTPGGVPGLTDSTEDEQPSQSEDKTDNPTSSKPDKESDLKYDQAGNPIFENVEIDFWSISIGSDGLIQKEIVDAFNEEYEGKIHVNRAERRHDEFSSAIVNTVVNDPENAPDIVQGHGERIRELQSQGIYVPLEEAIELSKIDYQRSNYFENILDDLYLEDDSGSEHLYGFPLDMHSNVIIARKDIIEKNGYEVPTNHQEFIEVCQGLADKAYAGTYQYLPTAQTNPDLEWMTSSAGTELYPWFMSIEALDDALTYAITGAVQNGSKMVDERGLPAWNTQSTIDYFEQMREYMYPSDGKRPLIQRSLSYEFISDFYKGNYIFASTGPWNLTGYKTIFDSAIGLGQGGLYLDHLDLGHAAGLLDGAEPVVCVLRLQERGFGCRESGLDVLGLQPRQKLPAANLLAFADFYRDHLGGEGRRKYDGLGRPGRADIALGRPYRSLSGFEYPYLYGLGGCLALLGVPASRKCGGAQQKYRRYGH